MKHEIVNVALLAALLSFTGCAQSSECNFHDAESFLVEQYGEVVLSKPLSVQQIEVEQLISIEVDGITKEVPFGLINDEWQQMKSKSRSGDCFVKFRTGRESWQNLAGREGYLLIRNGEIIRFILTSMS